MNSSRSLLVWDASFTIPAGSTDAVFGDNALIVLQSGAMAGNITFTATFTAAGAPLIPNSTVTLATATANFP